MKNSLHSLIAAAAVLPVVQTQASVPLNDAQAAIRAIADLPVAKGVEFLYLIVPANAALLLPVIFVTAVVTAALLFVHHLREDQRLVELADIYGSRTLSRESSSRMAFGGAAGRRLIPHRSF